MAQSTTRRSSGQAKSTAKPTKSRTTASRTKTTQAKSSPAKTMSAKTSPAKKTSANKTNRTTTSRTAASSKTPSRTMSSRTTSSRAKPTRVEEPVAKEQHVEEPAPVAINEPAQRKLYGGFNFGAAFYGWLISVGMTVIISAILTGVGVAIVFGAVKQITPDGFANSAASVSVLSGVLLLIVLAIAYYAGGYVAGRMSRFDGAKQGVGLWLLGLVIDVIITSLGALVGAVYVSPALRQVSMPQIANPDIIATSGLLLFVLILIVTLIASIIGGKVGENYHRKIDRAGTV